jgi:hypothetical protein
MNNNHFLTAAVATQLIDDRIREAQSRKLAAEARRASRQARTRNPETPDRATRRRWFTRPVTA